MDLFMKVLAKTDTQHKEIDTDALSDKIITRANASIFINALLQALYAK